jgi:hypothetical protein
VRISINEYEVHYKGTENIHPHLVIVNSVNCLLSHHERKINIKLEKTLILLYCYGIHASEREMSLTGESNYSYPDVYLV